MHLTHDGYIARPARPVGARVPLEPVWCASAAHDFINLCFLRTQFIGYRPYSESDADRPPPHQPHHCRRSASSPPLTLTLDADLEDDVFISPRTDNGNDPFSTRNIEIFGYGSPRTPAGVLLSPRRERSFTFSVTSEKHWRDKGGTEESVADVDVGAVVMNLFDSLLRNKIETSVSQ
ncbi:hypothetical protein ABMA27_008168 [Loxostege sticticalis]|uniref:Uncharacterized protein n=1 Tax=Loxostege sticticalis TaxID=481309 RepID=A0ABR3HE72_LOXSC